MGVQKMQVDGLPLGSGLTESKPWLATWKWLYSCALRVFMLQGLTLFWLRSREISTGF
jgi:hypothetical protein